MADINLTQAEADALIAMEKIPAEDRDEVYPEPGEKLVIALTSLDKKENFLLDITRNEINLLKVTFQNRARQIVVLMRLDLGGPPHRNPNGEEIACPHLHVYQEGFGDKWAFPVPANPYRNLTDSFGTFEDFMKHCNVAVLPKVQMGLF